MKIIVKCRAKTIQLGDKTFLCRIGRKGFVSSELGREGDEKTPLGHYRFRFGFYRSDRLPGPPPSGLPFRAMMPSDAWCDDLEDAAYNRFVRLPYPASHEQLWRRDGAYDIVLVMNHNDEPPERGLGSAVFFHIAQLDDRQTLGCIALTPDHMLDLVKNIDHETQVEIIA